MKTYKVPTVFNAWGVVEVKAENKEDLERKLNDKEFMDELPLPTEWEYVYDTYEVDYESAVYGEVIEEH